MVFASMGLEDTFAFLKEFAFFGQQNTYAISLFIIHRCTHVLIKNIFL